MNLSQRLNAMRTRFWFMPRLARRALGIGLLLGGALWFLPILGLWMIPLGLLVLSRDFPWARRGYLYVQKWLRKWRDRGKGGQARQERDPDPPDFP